MRLTWFNLGRTSLFRVAPTPREEIAATKRNWGKLGSIIPDAASPVAKTARSGTRTEGLSKDNFPSFTGALNRSDSRSFSWFIRHKGSPG
jgi:hypothetical protein